jgi:methylated-DNA-[protein]-cysteine S-methyltransferase
MTRYTFAATPVGSLLVAFDEADALLEIHFAGATPADGWARDDDAARPIVEQLDAFFDGRRKEFDLPLAPHGTPFQLAVWDALRRIPFGETTTYTAIAQSIGRPAAVRAVGAANGANPIPIVIPCHRVIGASGALTGFGGGLPVKRWLLDHEARLAGRSLF